jgi:uncharacterized protein YifN (PemK superfamily)
MPIAFSPDLGQILMCDFDSEGFIRPEMQKIRHCIVVSPRYRRHTGCCVVVPVSTVRPDPIELYHHQLPQQRYLCLDQERESWAKCDMVTHVAFARLDRPFEVGKRARVGISSGDLLAIQKGLLCAIGLPNLCSAMGLEDLTNASFGARIGSVPDKSGL